MLFRSLGTVLEPVNNVSLGIDYFNVQVSNTIVNGIGSAIILAFIWRSLLQIAHSDEDLRTDDAAAQAPPRPISQTAQQAAQAGG